MEHIFEDYLQDIHAKDYHGSDDDMSDDFERWLGEKDGNELIAFANEALSIERDKRAKALELAAVAIDELNKIKQLE